MQKHTAIALYGTVPMERGYCKDCKTNSFIRHGYFVCCGANTICKDNAVSNFVAACQVCNSLKSDKLFQDIEGAKSYLSNSRKTRGYDF